MDFKNLSKTLQPIIAILVFIMLIFICVQLYNYNELQKEINVNCGWSEENYKCYCDYSDLIRIQNEINKELNLSNINLSLWD